MSDNSDPITIPHQPGKLDFQIVEKEVSVTQFRRKPSAVWAYLETAGHVIVFTRRGKRAYLRLTDGGAEVLQQLCEAMHCASVQSLCEKLLEKEAKRRGIQW